MIVKYNEKFPAFNGMDKRRVYVYLPLDYEYEPERRYPVLYMFDGHNVFYDGDATYGKSWGVGKYLDEHRVPLIVVGVECNHGEDNARLAEYSPYDFSEEAYGSFIGHGRETVEWFVKKLKKKIDKKYRTIPDRDHTFIAGSSMGGLMSLYAVLEFNKYFSRCAALSPAINLPGIFEKVVELTRTADVEYGTVVYTDFGSEEIGYEEGVGFGEYVTELLKRGIFVTSRIVPFGQHCEADWEKQLPIFIETLMYGLDD